MRILMTGGGTGGHVNPALAIADYFKRMDPTTEIAFVGTSHGIENKLVPRAGYPLHHIEIQGVRRSLSLSNLKTLRLAASSIQKARKLLKTFKPDVVIGTGGYACFPPLFAASKMKIPTVIHEANAFPGLVVRLLQDKVDLFYINFDDCRKHLHHPDRPICVGNPLRQSISYHSKEEARRELGIPLDAFYILSLGGSMGAEPINFCMLDLMEQFVAGDKTVRHTHATGSLEWEATEKLYRERGLDKIENAELVEYVYDMPLRMAAADLVINRAGSVTLSELALAAKPSVLIPSPNVTDNHQFYNAKVLADADAAILIEEKDLTAEKIVKTVRDLKEDPERLAKMGERAASLARTDACEQIYLGVKRLLDERNKRK